MGKVYRLKDYKINPNDFKIIPNLIYLGLDVLFSIVLFTTSHQISSNTNAIPSCVRTLTTNIHFAKLTAEYYEENACASMFKFLCVNPKGSFSTQMVGKRCSIH